MALIDDLGVGTIAVDTSLFIYFIEEDPRFLPVVAPLFRAADEGKRALIASALTLLEVLVVPYRAGNIPLAERYNALLTRSRGIRIVDLTQDHMRAAAQIRASTGASTPDALQLAAALSAGCSAFVTNDRRMPAVSRLRIIQLGFYVM